MSADGEAPPASAKQRSVRAESADRASDETAPAAPEDDIAPDAPVDDRDARLLEYDRLMAELGRFVDEGDRANAENCARSVVDLTRELYGDDPVLIEALELLANLQRAREQWSAAVPTVTEIVEVSQRIYGEQDYRSVDARLILDWTAMYATLTSEQRQQLNSAAERRAQAAEFYRAGQFAKALEIELALMPIYRDLFGPRDPVYASTIRQVGLLYYELADLPAAEALLKEAMNIRRERLGTSHPEYASVLNNLAALYNLQGDFVRSEPLYRESLAVLKNAYGSQNPHYATELCNLASLYYEHREYAQAEALARESRDILRAREDDALAVGIDVLAMICAAQGKHDEGIQLYEEGLALWKEVVGEEHPDYAVCLHNLATERGFTGDHAAAEELLRRAIGIKERSLGPQHLDLARARANLALVLIDRERATEAMTVSEQALDTITRSNGMASIAQSERQQLVAAARTEWHVDVLLSCAQHATVPAERLYERLQPHKGHVFVRQQAMRRSRAMVQKDVNSEAARLFSTISEGARELDRLSKSVPAEGDVDRHRQRLERAMLQLESQQQRLAALSDEFGALGSAPASPAQLAAQLPGNAALVDFWEFNQYAPAGTAARWETQYVVFISRSEQPVRVVWLGAAEPINAAILDWRTHQGGQSSSDAAMQLRRSVWLPLEEHVADATTILVSADGALNSIPFSALPAAEPGRYLIEERSYVTVDAPAMLPTILTRHGTSMDSPTLLAIGDVDYLADPGAIQIAAADRAAPAARGADALEWRSLPNTPIEIDAIEAAFRKAFQREPLPALRRMAATEEQFRQQAPQAHYLHLATHGYFAPEQLRSILSQTRDAELATSLLQREDVGGWHPGLLSGIVLAGANQPHYPDRDDGVLTALEVAALDLTNTELVTLSACETGLGQTAGGEGVLGLQRAFQLAGARTTVTSLWSVPDDTTRALMIQFYTNLWQKKMSRVEALRQAQIHILRHGADDVRREAASRGADPPDDDIDANNRLAPRYWAAFVLSGDWR